MSFTTGRFSSSAVLALLLGCVPPLPVSERTDGDDSAPDTVQDSDSAVDTDTGPVVPVDADVDGHASEATGGDDCDDTDPAVNPDAPETCDGVDSNCSGDETDAVDAHASYPDADGDHYGDAASVDRWCDAEPEGDVGSNTDCDDADPDVHPDLEDTCGDGVDTDCDVTTCRQSGDWASSFTVSGDTASVEDGVWAVAVGDLVGRDGLPEMVLGQPHAYDAAQAKVTIFQGPFTGDRAAPSWEIYEGYADDDYLGMSLAADGDFDGDGEVDLIASSSYRNDEAGAAYLFREGSSESTTAADATLLGENAGDRLGSDDDGHYDRMDAMTMGCDLDGSGGQDVLVGAALADDAGGRVYGFSRPSGVLGASVADLTIYAAEPGQRLGHAIACIGDGNGDGHDDIALGVPGDAMSGVDAGAVYLMDGPLDGVTYLADATAKYYGVAGEGAGSAARGVGDLTGDGLPDLAVGTLTTGKVYILPTTESSTTQALGSIGSWVEGDKISGTGVAGNLDVDADGAGDLVLGYGGGSILLYGPLADGKVDPEAAVRWTTVSAWGQALDVGDVNADGFDDLAVAQGVNSDLVDVFLGWGT